jgi:adenine-specific DNA-methyltransferase
MNFTDKTRAELVAVCKERKLKGYSGKKKGELVTLLTGSGPSAGEAEKVCRLNYIGSKFQLLDWLTENIKTATGLTSFKGKKVADLFAGTGIVSYHFRKLGAAVVSNDAELYSSVITHAFTCSAYTAACEKWLTVLQSELEGGKHSGVTGYVTKHYTPYEGCERKFFTVENGRRIDYVRSRLEEIRDELKEDEYKFLLASLLVCADAVSNVPAVYGCFLKNFKAKAVKNLTLMPVHTRQSAGAKGSATHNMDIGLLAPKVKADIVYLDPPYNNRQYSKNYFPLNIIAKSAAEKADADLKLNGKTGIPSDCFLSPFCKKGEVVEAAFESLFRDLKSKWVFLSYNSESTVPKDRMMELMGKYGKVSVVERDYKRFKSFEYNADKDIKEFLFCLEKT